MSGSRSDKSPVIRSRIHFNISITDLAPEQGRLYRVRVVVVFWLIATPGDLESRFQLTTNGDALLGPCYWVGFDWNEAFRLMQVDKFMPSALFDTS